MTRVLPSDRRWGGVPGGGWTKWSPTPNASGSYTTSSATFAPLTEESWWRIPTRPSLRSRDEAPVHRGAVADLLGLPPRPRMYGDVDYYSLLSFEANDIALRDNETFSSKHYAGFATRMFGRSILEMGGDEHRRYRALVQPAFSPKRASWWIDKWIDALVNEAVSAFEARGWAELNAELCARIPLQTITSSFGMSQDEALEFRENTEGERDDEEAVAARAARSAQMLKHIIDDRRLNPQDDVITMLVQAEIEEDGERQLLTDDEVYGFARLILTAGSGTTWRQLGNLLMGLLRDADALRSVGEEEEMLRRAIEESVRWEPTDPIFRRLVTREVTLCGVDIPAGAIVEMNLGAANRDPARWEDPDRFDIHRVPGPMWASREAPTSVSACMWPAPRCSSP